MRHNAVSDNSPDEGGMATTTEISGCTPPADRFIQTARQRHADFDYRSLR